MYWGGLNRMVYEMSELDLLEITSSDPDDQNMRGVGCRNIFDTEITGAHHLNPTMRGVGCRNVLHSGQRRIEVSGPHLIEEASVIHHHYWTPPHLGPRSPATASPLWAGSVRLPARPRGWTPRSGASASFVWAVGGTLRRTSGPGRGG